MENQMIEVKVEGKKMKLRKTHNWENARKNIESYIFSEKQKIENHIKKYTSNYGGYYDSFEVSAPAIYLSTTIHAAGVRAIRAGRKTQYGRKKCPVYLTSPRLLHLYEVFKKIRTKAATPAEIDRKMKNKESRLISEGKKLERIVKLRQLSFSEEFAKRNHSTDSALAVIDLHGKNIKIEDIRELYLAITSNRETHGTLYPAWQRGEVTDEEFVEKVLGAYERHTYTNYDEILQENYRMGIHGEDSRDIARQNKEAC